MSDKEKEINIKRPAVVITGLVIAIIGLLLSALPIVNNFAFFLALISLILGIVGLKKTNKGKAAGRVMSIVVIVLSVLAGVIVLASQAWYGSKIDDVSDAIEQASQEINDASDRASGRLTQELLGSEVDVVMGSFVVTEGSYGLVNTELPITVTNKLAEQKTYSVQIEAVDANGNRIEDDSIYANDLGPNQSQNFKMFQYISPDKLSSLKAATFRVLSVSQY